MNENQQKQKTEMHQKVLWVLVLSDTYVVQGDVADFLKS